MRYNVNCDFIKNLTQKQKDELRKLLDTDTTPKYRVEVERYDNGNIKSLKEYLGDQRHGKDIGWYENGQKWWEEDYHQGQLHGKHIWWYESGQKSREIDYHQGQRHGKSIWWHEDGRKECERDYEYDKCVKEYEV
jgi:antitoxin component YwqK of YwqJK toxin-antitoxin module